MHYCRLYKTDVANGEGVRVTLFVSGCRNHCEGCFQPETWDFEYGDPFTEETIQEIEDALNHSYISGLTLLGGEPFEPENQKDLLYLVQRIKAGFPNKNIWCYTGCTYEQLRADGFRCRCEYTDELLRLIDVLVDGRSVEELKDLSLRFHGSSNQRVIDMKRTLSAGVVTVKDGM